MTSYLTKKKIQMLWSFGLFGAHRAELLAGQEVTKRPNCPVRAYKEIKDITAATSTLHWTQDPWQGKLDLTKHATFLEEAIAKHPTYAGDCDCFANYWLVSLYKSGLAMRNHMYMAITLWDGGGHAVASFKANDGRWYWAGNWNSCVPYRTTDEYGWIDGIQTRIDKPLIIAGRIKLDAVRGDDTAIYGKATRCA